MKRFIYFMPLLAIALFGCKGNDEPQNTQKQQITFKVSAFEQTTEPINSPRRAPQATILDDEGGTALTDLYVFDGSTQLVHQVYADDNAAFGTVTLELSHGEHNLSFICTRSTGITVENGVMAFGSIRPTFGKLLALNVTASTGAQDLTLDRITGILYITINDEFPATANQIEFVLSNKYNSINVASLLGVNGAEWSQKVSCTSKVGQSGVQYNFNTICPSLTEEYTSDLTINIYNSGNAVIYSVTIEDVRFAANTKTMLSGNLFTAPSASVSVNTTWNSNIVGSW
ncbi:MAG: hypothetical protein IKM83_04280 [Paludibacteraceae bacterium]|nr:hypothetical protein [Paludibacteraceae bacterium]